MKVKVTSAGITQKGISSHLLGTRFPTITTTLSHGTSSITIPRVPNKPTPRPHSMSVVVKGSDHDRNKRRASGTQIVEYNKGRQSVTLLRDPQTDAQNVLSVPNKSATSTIHYTASATSSASQKSTSNKFPKPKVQSTKSKPATQAIRIAVQTKNKGSSKRGTHPNVVHGSRKQITTKKTSVSNSTTKEVKQVFVKHTSTSSQAKTRSITVKKPQTSAPPKLLLPPPISNPAKKTVVTSQESGKSKPAVKSASKPATKRKAETPLPKTDSKVAKPGSKGADNQVRDVVEVVIGPEPEVEIIQEKAKPTTPEPTIASDTVGPHSSKKKRKHRTWKSTTTVKQACSLALIYGSTSSGVIEDHLGNKTKNDISTFSNAEKIHVKEMLQTPVANEIKDLLHAFGDSSEPLIETVQLMEEIVLHEVTGFIRVCEDKAMLRNGKTIGVMEALTALKRNIPRIERLYKFFGFKDIYDRKIGRLSRGKDKVKISKSTLTTSKMQKTIRELNLFDLYHLLDISLDEIESSLQGIEDSKLEEAVRSNPDMLKFYQYAKTRSLSFARKLSTVNIKKWIISNCHILAKMTDTFEYVLEFFILDFVAELLDSAFGIRKERLVTCSDTRVANPDTCMSAPFFLKKRKDDRCNQVSEILVQASEMEATRLKKDPKKSGERRWPETTISKPAPILYPGYIREAYMRIQTDPRRPTLSFPTRANILMSPPSF